ncbi:MAG: four helix bundle protein [Planctomycetes bacterium RBG_13_46_10]|nr:MAG: four helix bundle protein [Planctomycetes bacterium RBG_13_46_10]
MKNFRDIKVWHKAHCLAIKIYKVTDSFPREETYGLISQIRRAAASVPTNIAEGCGRNTDTELARFMEIASCSASELDYLILLANNIGLLDDSSYKESSVELVEIRKMLTTFIKTVRKTANH